MTRSIILHEFRDRGWDEGDPREIAESRVKLSTIIDRKVINESESGVTDDGGYSVNGDEEQGNREEEAEEGKMVEEWISDILGR